MSAHAKSINWPVRATAAAVLIFVSVSASLIPAVHGPPPPPSSPSPSEDLTTTTTTPPTTRASPYGPTWDRFGRDPEYFRINEELESARYRGNTEEVNGLITKLMVHFFKSEEVWKAEIERNKKAKQQQQAREKAEREARWNEEEYARKRVQNQRRVEEARREAEEAEARARDKTMSKGTIALIVVGCFATLLILGTAATFMRVYRLKAVKATTVPSPPQSGTTGHGNHGLDPTATAGTSAALIRTTRPLAASASQMRYHSPPSHMRAVPVTAVISVHPPVPSAPLLPDPYVDPGHEPQMGLSPSFAKEWIDAPPAYEEAMRCPSPSPSPLPSARLNESSGRPPTPPPFNPEFLGYD